MRPNPRPAPALRWALALLVVLALGVVWSGSANAVGAFPAHAELRSVTPADGATLAAPPAQVVLVFNEDVNPAFVQVALTRDGIPVTLAAPSTSSGTVTAAVPPGPDVVAGAYRIVYRVVSVDGHPVSGASQFTVTGPAAAGPSATTAPSTASPATSEAAASPTSPASLIATAPASAGESSSGSTAWVAGVVLVLVVAGLGGLWWHRRQRSAPPPV